MKEEWLMPGAIVPVTPETVVALIAEIKQMIDVVGVMALNQRPDWQGLTEEDFSAINQSCLTKLQAATSAESILKEKNA